jgi:hypothetical protein
MMPNFVNRSKWNSQISQFWQRYDNKYTFFNLLWYLIVSIGAKSRIVESAFIITIIIITIM